MKMPMGLFDSVSAVDHRKRLDAEFHTVSAIFSASKILTSIKDLVKDHSEHDLSMHPIYPGLPMVLVYRVKHDLVTNIHDLELANSAMIGTDYNLAKVKDPKFLQAVGIPSHIKGSNFLNLMKRGEFVSDSISLLYVRGILTPPKSVWNDVIRTMKRVLGIDTIKNSSFTLLADMISEQEKNKADVSITTKLLLSKGALSILQKLKFVPTDFYESHPTKQAMVKPSLLPRQYVSMHLSREFSSVSPYMPVLPSDVGYPKKPNRITPSELKSLKDRFQEYHPYKVIGVELMVNDPKQSTNPVRWLNYRK